jgi:cell wall assembly regulator SMI1
MEKPTPRYDEIARLFREHLRRRGKDAASVPATLAEVAAAERALDCRFPESYRRFQLDFGQTQDGLSAYIYGVRTEAANLNIAAINVDARLNLYPRLPPYLIAFSDDGGGDYYCFDIPHLSEGECRVVFWDHEQDEAQQPEVVAVSFAHWLEGLLADAAEAENERRLPDLSGMYREWLRQWLKGE